MNLKDLKGDEDRDYYHIALETGGVVIGIICGDYDVVFNIEKGVVRRTVNDTLRYDRLYSIDDKDELTPIEPDDETMKQIFFLMDDYNECRDYCCWVTSLEYYLDYEEEE